MSDVQETTNTEFSDMYANLDAEVDEVANDTLDTADEVVTVEAPADIMDVIGTGDETEEEIADEVEEEDSPVEEPARPRTSTRRKKASTIEDSDDVDSMYRRKVLRTVGRDAERKEFRGERVISKEGDTDIRTEASEKREEWERISNSIKNRKIVLTGTITGMDVVGEGAKKIVLAVVQLEDSNGHYLIKIPASHLFPMTAQKYLGDDPQTLNTIQRDMTFRIGSVIDFFVYDAKVNRKEVYATRVHAMSQLGYENYIRKDERTGKPRIKDGDIVKARVTLVGKYGLFAECCGAEFYISSKELDYNHFDDCREYYFAGDAINVKVSNIHTVPYTVSGQKLQMVVCDASKKQADPDPMELYWDDFKVGSVSKGVVKFRNEKGQYYVTLGGKVDCLCLPPNDGIPVMGQNCIVSVQRKIVTDTGTKLIYGKFIALLR